MTDLSPPKPRAPRKKAPPKAKTHPKKATPKENNYFTNLMKTPEGRALRKEWSTKKRKNGGRPQGVPDGHTVESIKPVREKAKRDAEKVVKIMSEKYNIEDEYQKEALKTAVEVMRIDGQTRERLAAARLVLDFTKSKPASKSDVSISHAEDVLASLLTDEGESVDEQTAEAGPEETT